MVIPNYIRSKMHLCASHARQAAKYDLEVANWLEKHGIDVEDISNGDGSSFEESCKQKSIAEMKKVPQNLHS